MFIVGTALLASRAFAAKLPVVAKKETNDGVTLAVKDLSGRFLDFYHAAQGRTPDERFTIWKDRYDFAAVPPTPAGEAMVRHMLDAAWPHYPAALPLIERGVAGMRPKPLDVAVSVARLLQAPKPLKFGFIGYVGDFEINAFTSDTGDGPVVAAPLELSASVLALTVPHEMTHAVHALTAHLAPGYERALGRVVFEEGLAMRATQALQPGLPDYGYVGDQPWFEAAMAKRDLILRALRPLLDARDGETVFKYTMGQGATGREREAYIAAWLVVGKLLGDGRIFPELARIPERQLPALVGGTIDQLLMSRA